MVNSIVPLAIFLGTAATAALAFFAFWEALHHKAVHGFGSFTSIVERAGMRKSAEEMVITWLVITAVLWIAGAWLLQASLVVGLLLLPIAGALAGGVYAAFVQYRLKARVETFLNQFETVLRLMASGLRSGLGLQQTLNLVIDESKDPIRYEFATVLGKANIGVSIYDALDDLADRVRASETMMMARVVRINSQTGGDLARVLEQLANTIRERRRMRRKVRSLTAEGRAGALVLGALPIFLGTFIITTQQEMQQGLLYTHVGHIVLGIIVVLEILGVFTLNRILQVNV
jgi:tight adherence protein B